MKNPITQNGYNDLFRELDHIMTKVRLEIAAEIETARGYGDISENAEYDFAKTRQAQNEAKIAQLQEFMSNAEVITATGLVKDGRVVFGVNVKLLNSETEKEVTYRIVGETESDIKNGMLSYKSPLAQEIIGQRPGDDVEVETPKGVNYYEILDVLYD